jgi:hypothetical protein
MMVDCRAEKQGAQSGTGLADQHLNNPDYTPHYDASGQLERVTGPDGKTALTFSDYQNGKPMAIGMPDGSGIVSTDGGETYHRVTADGATYPFPLRNLEVDKRGNITFDHPLGKDSRITVASDGTAIESPAARADWDERSKDVTMKMSVDGRTMEVVDKNGDPIRKVTFDANGNPTRIENGDGSTWHTSDGGKTWHHARADGSTYYYTNANMRVDKRGNISYDSPCGDRITESIDEHIVTGRTRR